MLFGLGSAAVSAAEQVTLYPIGFPRRGDVNYNAEWGHKILTFINGWHSTDTRYTTVHALNSFAGEVCYCIEVGVPQDAGDVLTYKGENFWMNYPSEYNKSISPDDIRLFIGRIMQYGYIGTASTSWRSDNDGGDKLAHAFATQLLIWETVIGERDENFEKVNTGSYDAILDLVSNNHPLRNKILSLKHTCESNARCKKE